MSTLRRRTFEELAGLFFEGSGIQLGPEKLPMVETRLRGRVEELEFDSFEDYSSYLTDGADVAERQHMINLLTVNETYFFREPEQFEELSRSLDTRFRGRPMRLWSAACSTGEEPYSIAMTMLNGRPEGGWEVRATDLATRVVERARTGVFPLQRLEHMPDSYLKRFCLRGTGEYEGTFRVSDQVRKNVSFSQHNLLYTTAVLGTYEVIFLRNVLIYFRFKIRSQILSSITDRLCSNGLLFIGTAESLQGHELPLRRVGRSVFEKI